MSRTPSSSRVLWAKVWGLATIQGAISLMWVIYNLYLVDLLTQFGFPKQIAASIVILENILAAIMEPLMGNLSDRVQQWIGSRFLFIALGVIIAALCFIAIPTTFIFQNAATRWILPIVLVAWALAMTFFRSPAMSLLGRYAFLTNLPQAASILTLVGALAGATGPLASQFILGLGPGTAFAIGSITLLAAAGTLRVTQPDQTLKLNSNNFSPSPSKSNLNWLNLGLIFGAGLGVALGFRLLMQTFPAIVADQIPDANSKLILGGIFIALAITAIPAGKLAVAIGSQRAMVLGLVSMAICLTLTLLSFNLVIAFGVAIALGSTFSLVSNGTIPFALSLVPSNKAGLGTGIYFSGSAVATSLFIALFKQSNSLAPNHGALIGAAAFLMAGGFVALSRQHPSH